MSNAYEKYLEKCELCPRKCGTNRLINTGYCGAGKNVRVARAALHFMEEPCISGKSGSGTVFFSGCNLKCCFCQNFQLSHEGLGKEISIARLSDIFLELQDKGANNINLVTGTMYVPHIINALDMVKHKLKIPVVYNCGGYEKSETIDMLKGYVDIYLQDIKYYDDKLSIKYSNARNYFINASESVKKMLNQTGPPVFYEKAETKESLLKKGVIIRHLVLPGAKEDSIKILKWMSENLRSKDYLISIMSQYTPYYHSSDFKEINRLVTTYEYNKVIDKAIEFGIDNGFMQDKSSAKKEYTPDFDFEGI